VDSVDGLARDRRLGVGARAQISVHGHLQSGNRRGALPQYVPRCGASARLYGVSGQLGWAAPIYVAESDEQARDEAKAGIETLFNNFLSMPWEMLLPPGYTSNTSLKATLKLRPALGGRPRQQTIDELIASGTIVVGSPATVRERIERVREQTGFEILITLLQFGVLPDHLARRNMEMFAAEVMPKLR
jgi:alkanesulfonate monooxygenase SsuD/methylene tetrahydromethanopterin reductase-like flavin-dependent oxidoreductase (luciferase family)